MPMTKKNRPGAPKIADGGQSLVSQDERLAATVSAYLDGELTGADLAGFEELLRNNAALSREVMDMRRLDRQLTELGADILAEPIPDILLEPLSRFNRC